ncbi:MAG: winged helix-turn-helix domain-containing protein [Mycobacteriales bacterium]
MSVAQQTSVVAHRRVLEAAGPFEADRRIDYLRIVVRNLRQKLEADWARPSLIMNELGVGYRLMVEGQCGGAVQGQRAYQIPCKRYEECLTVGSTGFPIGKGDRDGPSRLAREIPIETIRARRQAFCSGPDRLCHRQSKSQLHLRPKPRARL